MPEADIILEEVNPYETFAATVENDGRTIYLYMSPLKDESLQPKAVWIQNLIPAPDETDRESMKKGMAPLLKKSSTRHPDGLPGVEQKRFGILWFQEGNGVAVYIDEKLSAVIPPWSGRDGLFGYSSECISQDAGTVPLEEHNTGLLERIKENEEFWKKRNSPSYWSSYRDSLLENFERTYGKHTKYYTLSDRKYPPLAVVEFNNEDKIIYATLGMSFQNMPGVEMESKTPDEHVRSEIITARSDETEWMPGLMGRIAIYPWLFNRWLGDGHTYESGLTQPFTDFILTKDYGENFLKKPAQFEFENRQINFLLAVPIHQEDSLVIKARGIPHVLKRIREKAQPVYRWPQ